MGRNAEIVRNTETGVLETRIRTTDYDSRNPVSVANKLLRWPGVSGLRHSLRPCTGRRRWKYLVFQRFAKDLPHILNKNKANILERLFWNFVQVSTILLRQYYSGNSCSARGQNLFFYTTDW